MTNSSAIQEQTMLELNPVQCHDAGHSIPETTLDTQRPQEPLSAASGGEMEEKEKQKDMGTMERSRTKDLRAVRNSLT